MGAQKVLQEIKTLESWVNLWNEVDKKAEIYLKPEEECLAACCGAPMMMVDHVYHENLTPQQACAIVDDLE